MHLLTGGRRGAALLLLLAAPVSWSFAATQHAPLAASPAQGARPGDIPAANRLETGTLALALQRNAAPLVLMVGPRTMYDQAHILKAEYAGAASSEAGLATLRTRVMHLEKEHWIVLYCGCCPWERCPNIRPAFAELQGMGFTHVQVLFLPQNFGADWVNKGLPTEQ